MEVEVAVEVLWWTFGAAVLGPSVVLVAWGVMLWSKQGNSRNWR